MAGRFEVIRNFELMKKGHVGEKWKRVVVMAKAPKKLRCVEKNDLTFDDNTISDDVL